MGAGCLRLGCTVLIRALALSSLMQSIPGISSTGEIQTDPEPSVGDEQERCPPCAPRGTAGDTKSQKSSSPAPWEKEDLLLGHFCVWGNSAFPPENCSSGHLRLSARVRQNISKTTSKAMLSVNQKTQAPPDWNNGADSSRHLFYGDSCSLKAEGPYCDTGLLCVQRTWPSSTDPLPGTPHPGLPTAWSSPEGLWPLTQCPDRAGSPAIHRFPETGAWATPTLGVRVHTAAEAALCLLMDFGDSSGAAVRLCNMTKATVVTAYHQYRKEGVYQLRAIVYEFCGSEVELGPYYVEIGHETVSVFMNSSSVHKDEVFVFAGSHPNQKSTVVMHHFQSISSYNVSFISQTQVGDGQAWPSVTVWYKMQPVSVYTNGTAFATDTDVTFVAVTKEPTALELTWYFGDDPPVRSPSRSIRRRLRVPQWYRVTVEASSTLGRVVSEAHLVRVQKSIVANRLVSPASALVNTSVAFECRLTFGTDVTYLWNFGDGTVRLGSSSTRHVYGREGDFTVEVLAFNNVSSTALRKQLFIVREPCQPPPVKNMGPAKVQIWRSQPLRLGVTFEAAVLCDISRGLSYTWSFMDSEGSPVALPAAISTHRQTIMLPGYSLECGHYTALAKVQIEGSVVHSNYCVGVEVRARAPISVISEGTHLFVPRAASAPVVLRGSQSYDPDNLGAALRYHWTCAAASSPRRPCFDDSAPHVLGARLPAVSFAAKWLSECCDQFLVTLTVSSGGRNSSEAQVFLSTRPDPAFRFVHISWVNFKDTRVNQNDELSLQAACEDCGDAQGLSYSWDLFLVNATEKNNVEVPFCSIVGLLGASALWATLKSPEPNLLATGPTAADPDGIPTTLGPPALLVTGNTSMESIEGGLRLPAAGDTLAPGEPSEDGPLGAEPGSLGEGHPTTSPSEGSWTPSMSSPALDDFEAYYSDIQEAVPSQGRRPGNGSSLPGSGPSTSAEGSPDDGDNLLGPFLSIGRAKPTLLIDWPKTLVGRTVFRGYTSSGIMGQAVTIKPYALRSGETYVLQASVASRHSLLGKAQLYLTVNRAPQDMACQVQPHSGLEARTIFSVFCMSGKPDFLYEFSYWVGNASKHTLYRGRDTQYYFALPAGDPLDNYKVIVSTEITDGKGSKVQPCAVAVTVLPRYHGNDCPGEDLYNSSLKSLSTLQLMGSYREIRNYITMITGMEEVMESILTLKDLISFPNKLSFTSAARILRYTQTLLAQGQFSGRFVVDKGLRLELVLLISGIWEASEQEKWRNEDYLQEEGMKVISDILLGSLSLNHARELSVSTGQMEFRILLHHTLQSSVQSLGSVQVHLPGDLARHSPAQEETQSPCYISQLMFFKRSPYPGGQAPGKVGSVVGLALYSCSRQSRLRTQRLQTPVTVEFGDEDGPDDKTSARTFVLLRDKVNFHQFIGLSENPQESLQIQVEFSKPVTRAFPIMLLVRFSKKPTPSDFLVKQIYFWDEQVVQIYIPPVPPKGASIGYLSLLDADYDRRLPNKYLARAVNYTVRFQWIRCLFWDKREWRSESFSPQRGTSPERVNCSYNRLAPFSVLRRKLNASLEVSDLAELQSHPQNLLPSIFIVVFMILYGYLITKARCVDCHDKKKTGYIFLQEDTPPGHQLYAVVIDTGFRSPTQFTSKVFIVLCGENGLSETKELCCSEKPLFERNSRHTFILSAADQLGPLQKIRLWHDSRGPSPSWFISHVMVKELRSGQGWFFPAQCWLAANRSDGRVERELSCLRCRPGFQKLFYSKFSEYLEDFHIWLSVYTWPSSSGHMHPQRLTVSFCLLCVHACLAALVTAGGHEQPPMEDGPTDITFRSFSLALLCTLLASPAAQLLSLLFRLSKEATGCPLVVPCRSPRGAQTEASQGPNSGGRMPDARKPYEHPASAILSGSDGTWRKASEDSTSACPRLESEACGAEHSKPALRDRGHHRPTHLQGPSSGFEGLTPQRSRACWPWLSSAAWTICGLTSLACGLGTGFLGYRFVPAQCVRWLHLLCLSVVCCGFITQPLLICFMALGFAWKRKDDNQFFTESLCEATRNLDLELEEHSGTRRSLPPSCSIPDSTEEVEKVLAARRQERHLRWARPPPMAQLSVIRERLRREGRTQAALRDTAVHILTLLLLLFVTRGKLSPHECSLNQAIREEFVRNARHSLGSLRGTDDWWDWSLTTLLDGLHPGDLSAAGAPGAQPGALGGRSYIIGTSIIKQLKVSPNSLCKAPRPLSALMEDSLPTCSPEVGGLEKQNVTHGCPRACGARKEDCLCSLGRTRPEAQAALTALRASRWIDRSTRVVAVHFALYNPPTQLFTSVTLSAEVLPTGGLLPSSLVESFSIFRSDSATQYYLVLPELVFLVLTLTHLCHQLCGMVKEGVLSYWRKPRSWMELSEVGLAITYYAASGHLAALTGDVADQFRRGLCQAFLDLSPMALWNQRVRWLRGILSFLWMLKCIYLLGFRNTMASCSPVMRLSRAFSPVVLGVLLLAAHCHLLQFLLFTWAPPAGTSTDSVPGLLFRFPGRSQEVSFHSPSKPDQQAPARSWGALVLLTATLCFGALRASLMMFFRKRKSFHSKSPVTLKDVAAYMWQKVLFLLGLETPTLEEAEVAADHNHYLDEFTSLLDELLMKINGLSDSLELPILEKQPRRTVEAMTEDSPLLSVAGYQANGKA